MIKDTIGELLRDNEPKVSFAMGSRPWKQRALSVVAGCVMACSMLSSPDAEAGSKPRDAAYLSEIGVEFVELGAVKSKPDESKSDFMMRTARYLDAFTRTTGHEACGTIMSNDQGQWQVRLLTNRAQMACVLVDFEEFEKEWRTTQETIHSHPLKQYAFKTNLQDNRLSTLMGNGRVCGGRVRTDDYNFSQQDYESGSGYLVARGRLFYQSKPGERLEMGKVDRRAPLEPLEIAASGPGKIQGIQAAGAAWTSGDAEGLPRTQCPVIKR